MARAGAAGGAQRSAAFAAHPRLRRAPAAARLLLQPAPQRLHQLRAEGQDVGAVALVHERHLQLLQLALRPRPRAAGAGAQPRPGAGQQVQLRLAAVHRALRAELRRGR
jgi:hypothetical protein